MKRLLLVGGVALLCGSMLLAQRGSRPRFGGGGGGGGRDADLYETPREMPQHSTAEDGSLYVTPNWTNPVGFEKDAFTFVRIKRERRGGGGFGGFDRRGGGGSWGTDTPDSDLNLSWRLKEMTAIRVDPNGRFLRLTQKDLVRYPFIYMVEPGSLFLDDAEILALRKHLLNGAFLWLDDFWGDSAWENVEGVLRQVFPDRKFQELNLDHALYHGVFEIKAKSQVPAIGVGQRSRFTGVTWENHDGDCQTVHHKAIFDDKGRMMVLATHNTDNGDGWEREGENHEYFEDFSEKVAYPLAVNVFYYMMTH